MAKRSITDTLKLTNNIHLPQLGFGVYDSPPDVTARSCLSALKAGYRHIDTAQFYANEAEVGRALQQSGIPRKDVFLTTKILSAAGSVAASYEKCVDSVRKLDPTTASGYVDLFLIHSPKSGAERRREMWTALERLYEEGKARSIGVSNFGIGHIREMREYAKVWPPHVNQIELHPWCQQKEIVEYCNQEGIIVEAYCPLVRNRKADDPTTAGIAKKHSVTASQVLIRWSIQKGWSPLPKSDNPERIAANADVYGFDLDDQDMAALDGLDQGSAGAIVQVAKN